ncbi:MAG: RNA-directed DNA polymerase [Bacilli bacterium]|nr:RNA-directed DNA polymerase [Bacilli bacterium]
MKKNHVKYDEILSYEVIESNYRDICSKTRHRNKIVKFDLFHSTNVNSIYNELKDRKYRHSKYNIFLIKEPKYRIVMSESIKDKIVNHIISNSFLKPALYPKLIEENVATRVGKGTNAAIELCKKYFVRMMNKYRNFYILKFDISKYFYNIDHQVLKQMLAKIYTDQEVLRILYEVIDSTDAKYINGEIDNCINKEIERLKVIGNKEALNQIGELNRIPHYYDGKGLGIGSLSNQIFAVFYLNGIDHYIKEDLGIKEYVRFMDDGIIFSHDKEYLKRVKVIIGEKLKDLKLNLNDKTAIYSAKGGFDFVGYRFSLKNGRILIRIKNQTKRRIKRKFLNLEKHDPDKLVRVKASYKGMLNYCTTKSFYNKNYGERK